MRGNDFGHTCDLGKVMARLKCCDRGSWLSDSSSLGAAGRLTDVQVT